MSISHKYNTSIHVILSSRLICAVVFGLFCAVVFVMVLCCFCYEQGAVDSNAPMIEGRMPGYLGYCPGYKNHSLGGTFAQCTKKEVSARSLFDRRYDTTTKHGPPRNFIFIIEPSQAS